MFFGLKIALRHLTANLGQTSLLVLGVAIGVMVFIFMSALIAGLADLMVMRTLGNFSHITIEQKNRDIPVILPPGPETVLVVRQKSTRLETGIQDAEALLPVIEALPEVVVTSPQILGSGVLVRGSQVRQVAVTGLAPDRVSAITDFDRIIQQGSIQLTGDSLLVGAALADDLNITVGHPVSLRADNGNVVTLTLTGVFRAGATQLDEASAFIDIDTAKTLFNMPQGVSRIEVKLEDLYTAEATSARIGIITGLEATPWTAGAEQLYEALRAQANTGIILQVFALITIVIGVASALMLSTYRRRGEIGIMRAMGAQRKFVLFVFIVEGAMIGLVGGIVGAVLSVSMLMPFPDVADVQPGQLPIDIAQGSVGLAILLTTLGATLAAILPARSASRVDPVTAIGQ